ncbi:MAG: hypothetical protein IID37_04855 [Planctomycetes bacterium]|nr:hypothetical protein [Planctomycetota bacterium]
MDALRQLLARIQSQLGMLNRSQQMVIGLCAVLIAGSLLWLVQWSADPVYVTLLPRQPMTALEIENAEEVLRANGADYRVGQDRILVRSEDRHRLMSALNVADALPVELAITFASLMEDDSPFRPESENASRRNIALGNELAMIIAASPDVAAARVIVQPLAKRAIGSRNAPASASVSVTMVSGRSLTNDRVRGVARLVAGAVPGLEPHMVAVIDGNTGRPWIVPRPEDEVAFGLLEERKKYENHLLGKIMEQLAYIPGVLVAISVELDTEQIQTTTTTWDEGALQQDSTFETETTTGGSRSAPGTNSNVGMALSAGGSSQSSTSTDSKQTFYEPRAIEQVQTKKTPFAPKRATASINVPRSYVAGIHKATSGTDTEPTDTELDPIKALERTRIQGLVQNVLMSMDSNDVQVDFYYDLKPGEAVFAEMPGGLAMGVIAPESSWWSALEKHVPQIGLGILGIVGLVSMARMVRKSAQIAEASRPTAVEPDSEVSTGSDGILTVEGGPVGMAAVSEGYLTGHEVDDDTLRAHELREQVSTMVEENPDNAADLIRRWVEQPT